MGAWAVLPVSDLEASLSFCTEVLGWTAGERPGAGLAYVHDNSGDPLLLAGPDAGEVTAHAGPRAITKQPGDTLYLLHPDVEATQAQLRERGLSVPEITATAWEHVLHVPAPDGYIIGLVTPIQLSMDAALARYIGASDELDAALAGLSEGALDLAPGPGEWSIRQIVHHIADGDDLWSMALKAALAASGCAYEQDWYSTDNACAESLDYAGRAITPAVALLRANRAHVEQLVRHLPGAWERHVMFTRATAPEPQKITAGAIVTMQARHSLEHIEEIHATRRLHGR